MRVKENASTAQAKPRRDWPDSKDPTTMWLATASGNSAHRLTCCMRGTQFFRNLICALLDEITQSRFDAPVPHQKLKSCGFTRVAHRVAKKRRRSWALANFPSILFTTTRARRQIAEMTFPTRLSDIWLSDCTLDSLNTGPTRVGCGVSSSTAAKSGVSGSNLSWWPFSAFARITSLGRLPLRSTRMADSSSQESARAPPSRRPDNQSPLKNRCQIGKSGGRTTGTTANIPNGQNIEPRTRSGER